MGQVIQRGGASAHVDPATDGNERKPPRRVYAVIVGTGFSGLGMAIRLK